jgi:2-keto-4-pentenoate hydratase/2-oxohepta-3-ene-1,7-dioic acid hydratase in catechol pathway
VVYNKESGQLDTGVLPMLIPAGVNVHYEVELAVIMAHPWGGPRAQKPDWTPNGEGVDSWEHAIHGYAIGMFNLPHFSCRAALRVP